MTTSISLIREHTEKVKPPRALWVSFPYGMPLGRAGDAALQHRVLAAAFALMDEPAGPVLRDFPEDLDDGEPAAVVQASAVAPGPAPAEDVAMEVTRMRRYHEQWATRAGRTSVGLTRIPPERFRGVVRFLEAFADGQDADMRERPDGMPLHTFLRMCVDDLKAMYVEARLAMQPDATGDAVARWLWGETALGALLRRVKERLETADDPRLKATAQGIAR
ncbi:MAG: hypothetical protein U0531_07005 [Dehalococcoidia bacterium]